MEPKKKAISSCAYTSSFGRLIRIKALIKAGGWGLRKMIFLPVLTSSFGSLIRSKRSGIIFNDEMDDFTVPGRRTDGLLPDEYNYVEPGKRPQSSTVPTVVLDSKGKVRIVAGASGGAKITTAVAQVGGCMKVPLLVGVLEAVANSDEILGLMIPYRTGATGCAKIWQASE